MFRLEQNCGLLVRVQISADPESVFRFGVGDQIHYNFMTPQRLTMPVLADIRKESMLDLVPLAGPRRKVADRDMQASFVGEFL
jgi:hypothetical protein